MIDRRVRTLLIVDAVLALALLATGLGGDGREAIDFELPGLATLDGMRITRTGQPPVELQKRDGRWTVDGDPLDPYALDALTAAMAAPVGADLAVEAEGAALDDYGLGEHAATVTFGDGPPVRIGRVVDGRRTFAWPVGGERILRLRADLGRVFHRPAAQWTDRRLVPLDFAQVAELAVRRGEAVDWRARRPDRQSPWALVEPAGLEAGQQEVDAVASALVTARAEGFASAEGFAPTLALDAVAFDGRRFTIELAPGERETLRARLPGRARLAVIPRHQAVFLDARAADLRERRIFGPAVTLDGLDGVAIGGPDPLRARRDAEGRWWLDAPRAAGPLNPEAVDGWLAALVGLRAVGFVERPEPAAFEQGWPVALKYGDRAVSVEVGAPFGQGARQVRRADQPERVMVLGASGLATLRPDLDLLIASPEAPADQPPGR